MRRTLRVESLNVGQGQLAGKIVVADWVEHPERGRVRCPAAALLAGSLRRAGLEPVRVEHLRAEDLSSRDITCSADVAAVASYVDRDGSALGMAAAVPGGDRRAAALVLGAVRQWAQVLRTRRIALAAVKPWCTGLEASFRALDQLLSTVAGPVHVLGTPPPCRVTTEEFIRRGTVFVESLDQVPDGALLHFGPAGASPLVRAKAATRDLVLSDGTCPLVAAAAGEVRRLAEEGATVVVVADPAHAAVPTLTGQAPEQVVLVNEMAQADAVRVGDPGPIGVVVEPGADVARLMRVAERVRARFDHVRPQHPATLCHEPSDRHNALRLLAEADVVLVVGKAAADDSEEVVARFAALGVPAFVVASAGEVEPDWLRTAGCVGVTASLTADPGAVDGVVDALRGLGPSAVVEVAVRTSPVVPRVVVPPVIRPTPV
ncbi:hypothetical protein ABZ816_00100 [Actinosynnema sp. NPDC047251]|uniref:Putative 4-hydroxy-3-methylbut-2-enyl diphosphate reductase n=1 Tax=Saccharothrix espanaensis (strain ATCC 51144 / DSM 44229 / JCM 9112 / NBRC 15066 / NRRL 15764) TaxID=1179773 RepID=K0JSJ0_SACES|nr:putative 4-hydroxy-3-methylbut-2-enyl diphosphate reductase [Saccharothrix espanaensis]CCH30650.1 putative 4-hydroxy-3-methylbut-2-enyl diphosphate reductase [Saccharothrix espanaensis DSM 44229]